MNYKAIIVEDEFLLANVIENYLEQFEQIELVGKFTSALEGLRFLESNTIDLIFLDIEMPLINGIEFAKKVDKSIDIIFTTAYSEYAVDGFDLSALDYLLKPIKFDRFMDAIQKFTVKQQNNSPQIKQEHLIIKSDGEFHKIELKNLIYIESLKEYLRYHTCKTKFIVYGSLSKVSDDLQQHNFIRIHKSYLCNLDHIKSIKGNEVVLSNGVTLSIGRTYKSDVLKYFK